MLRSSRPHLLIALALFITELLIAFFVHDRVIRPYIGDLLVVMLIHFTVRGVTTFRRVPVAVGTLLFAFVVELAQALDLIHRLGWEGSTTAHLLLGSTFQWWDVVAYILGVLLAVRIDRRWEMRTVC